MADPELTLSRTRFDAVLFDLDGVVTRTAELHAAAWKVLFDGYLKERPPRQGEDHSRFDADRDYRRYIDGKPRYKGVQHFLLARGIRLPMGEPSDPPERETVCGLGNRKNRIFRELIDREGVEIYGCASALARSLRRAGFKVAVVTASKNCTLILERAGLGNLFDVRIDGIEAERLGLDGKPDPDTFLEAACRLGADPARSIVLEDATAGVTAARRGRFGLVIGVDRGGQRGALLANGADLVFADLCRVQVEPDGTGETVPPVLSDMLDITRRLADKSPALFLDYDGTLTPIVERPEDARLSEDVRRTLRDAARLMPVAVISGRDLEDVEDFVSLPGIYYAGSHGFEIRGDGVHLELPEGIDALDDLAGAASFIGERLAAIPGAELERKRFALAVHFRRAADADEPGVKGIVEDAGRRFPRLRMTGGKKIFELRPDIDWDKGRAVRWLLTELGLDSPDVLPIYIGDDSTDEDAFRALRERGIGILVSAAAKASFADYRVRSTEQVAALLRYLVQTEAVDE